MPTLRFHETHKYNFPVTTTGGDTALTICRLGNDPMLAFLTQTSFDDEVVYLAIGFDHEYMRHPSPPGRQVISGMGFNPNTEMICCGCSTSQMNKVFCFDPNTGQETGSLDLSADSNIVLNGGFATNGIFFVRAANQKLELRNMSGVKIGEKDFIGRSIRSVTASPWSWTFGDLNNNEIVVIGPFGNEIATAPAPGTAGGLHAIAYDTVSNLDAHPQVWLEPGIIGAVGSIHHPDTPWDPEPWKMRHRIYVANQSDQIIYAGYLTEF